MQDLSVLEPRTTRASIAVDVGRALQANARATSLEEVLRQTSVTQQDVNDAFGGTRELLVAMVAQLSQRLCEPLNDSPSASASSYFETLRAFAELVIDTYLHTHLPVLYRIGVTESIRNTGAAKKFYEAGPGCITQCLARFIDSGHEMGFIVAYEASPLLASHFMALLRSELDLSDIFPSAVSSPDARTGGGADSAVALFRRGVSAEAAC